MKTVTELGHERVFGGTARVKNESMQKKNLFVHMNAEKVIKHGVWTVGLMLEPVL